MRNLIIVSLLVLGAIVLFLSRSQGTPSPVDKLQPNTSDRYVEYTPESFAQASNQRRVLFFYAAWCPTCRPLDRMLQENSSQIPEDLVIFRTNYDTETELKAKYSVTYQHTFVQVDANGDAITSWNGGGIAELLTNIK